MGKDVERGLNGLVPRDEPLTMGIDHLVRSAGPKDDLQLPDALGTSLIVGEAVLSCKDMVEVNSLPGK